VQDDAVHVSRFCLGFEWCLPCCGCPWVDSPLFVPQAQSLSSDPRSDEPFKSSIPDLFPGMPPLEPIASCLPLGNVVCVFFVRFFFHRLLVLVSAPLLPWTSSFLRAFFKIKSCLLFKLLVAVMIFFALDISLWPVLLPDFSPLLCLVRFVCLR